MGESRPRAAGSAVIENGRLSEQSSEPLDTGRLEFDVEIGGAGELELAIACRRRQTRSQTGGGEGWIGYCASSDRHAWFRWDGALELIPTDASIEQALLAELEDIAFEFAGEWLWYDDAPRRRRRSSAAVTRKRAGRCAAQT